MFHTFKNLKLERPLAVLDLETTGLDPSADRIVEIGILLAMPDGTTQPCIQRIDPQRPIPPEATAIHGIGDADVAGCPPFAKVTTPRERPALPDQWARPT